MYIAVFMSPYTAMLVPKRMSLIALTGTVYLVTLDPSQVGTTVDSGGDS